MQKKRSHLHEFLDTVFVFVVVCALYVVFRYFIRFPIVNGQSMEPTYHNGDKLAVLYTKNVNRNDIVVSWSEELNEYIVKRVIGIPGDKIEIQDGILYRNGFRVYESYLNDSDWHTDHSVTVLLKDDEFFLLGDNRNNSMDSREFGAISRDDIFGKVLKNMQQEKGSDNEEMD